MFLYVLCSNHGELDGNVNVQRILTSIENKEHYTQGNPILSVCLDSISGDKENINETYENMETIDNANELSTELHLKIDQECEEEQDGSIAKGYLQETTDANEDGRDEEESFSNVSDVRVKIEAGENGSPHGLPQVLIHRFYFVGGGGYSPLI